MVRSRKITHLVACIVTLLAMGVAVAQHATAQAANADDPITGFFTGISLIAWAFGLIPTIIAFSRGHASKELLAVLNVIVCLIGIIPIFGWIVAPLGWIGIFIWAASGAQRVQPSGRVRVRRPNGQGLAPLDRPREEVYPLPPETGEDKNKLEPAHRGVEIEKLKRQDLTEKPNLND